MPIKVIFSYSTGVELSWSGGPYGFGVQMRVRPMLQDPEIQTIPVIEREVMRSRRWLRN
jgi:hypothetical protein